MSFSESSNSEANHVTHFKLCFKEIKGRTIISNEQNVENEAHKIGFTLLKIKIIERFKLKLRLILTQKFKNQFYTRYAESFQLQNCLNFEYPSTGSGEMTGGTLIESKNDIKQGNIILYCSR